MCSYNAEDQLQNHKTTINFQMFLHLYLQELPFYGRCCSCIWGHKGAIETRKKLRTSVSPVQYVMFKAIPTCFTNLAVLESSSRCKARLTLTFMSAPDRSSLAKMRSSRVTSSATVMRLVWIWKILLLVFSSGSGNSIFRSILPEEGGGGGYYFSICNKTLEIISRVR